ncbi:MAG TPA: hypothetical protein VK464_06325 [Symbiobacteriaceae bacterium]|jgi:hypothetical protein|nr:hypothetical protein [Symbiobacteriaceae bacterium]
MAEEKKDQLTEETKVKKIGDQARVVDGGTPKVQNPAEDDGQNSNIICIIDN